LTIDIDTWASPVGEPATHADRQPAKDIGSRVASLTSGVTPQNYMLAETHMLQSPPAMIAARTIVQQTRMGSRLGQAEKVTIRISDMGAGGLTLPKNWRASVAGEAPSRKVPSDYFKAWHGHK
jgi:hypothetical protein